MFGDEKKKKEELRNEISTWWDNLKYLKKMEILLENYPKLDITGIEFQGVANLWREIGDLERKKLIMDLYKKEERG